MREMVGRRVRADIHIGAVVDARRFQRDADAGAQGEGRPTGFGAAGDRWAEAAPHLLALVGAELVVPRGDAGAHDRAHRRPTTLPYESHRGIHNPREESPPPA